MTSRHLYCASSPCAPQRAPLNNQSALILCIPVLSPTLSSCTWPHRVTSFLLEGHETGTPQSVGRCQARRSPSRAPKLTSSPQHRRSRRHVLPPRKWLHSSRLSCVHKISWKLCTSSTTVNSTSTKTARGTCFPAPVSATLRPPAVSHALFHGLLSPNPCLFSSRVLGPIPWLFSLFLLMEYPCLTRRRLCFRGLQC